ncbi:MAG: hypothetical protein BalsKO_05930 [Balneolaceae bacterium]
MCSENQSQLLETHRPEWNSAIELGFEEKCAIIGADFENVLHDLFPWKNQMNSEIEFPSFSRSFLIQPDVFLRIRPGEKEEVEHKLNSAKLSFNKLSYSTLSVPQSAKISDLLNTDSEIVIQDLSSQKVGDSLEEVLVNNGLSVWDCCAASGGKALMAYDLNQSIKLTVSDVRESILHNLRSRFYNAGIQNYKAVQADLAKPSIIPNTPFDVIIADVPCTGSGTWSRTPEQIIYFEESKIQEYGRLQKAIISNVIPHLKPDGVLVYITCSVFKKENEENVDFFKKEYGLEEQKREVLKGYDQKADSMFVSVFKKSL